MSLAELPGTALGERTVTYTDRDAMLYAVAVGATKDQLPLVWERDLRVLPTFGLALACWAAEQPGEMGLYDRTRSLHAEQRFLVRKALPPEGSIHMEARIVNVWDKGRAALVEIATECEHFVATSVIFLPGMGGWGGDRGPSAPPAPELDGARAAEWSTDPGAAILYRLTGDRHPVHVDPELARQSGLRGPILHGLCTIGMSVLRLAGIAGADPWDLEQLSVRLSAPVYPGDTLRLEAGQDADGGLPFAVSSGGTVVLSNGRAAFSGGD